jgi:type II secretory pathway component PulF
MTSSRRIRLPAAQRILLFRQLQMLLAAGILLSDALRSLRDRFPDRATRRLLAVVHAEVMQSRRRFSAALSQFPRSFPPADIAILAAGESGGSGQLADRLGDLADRVGYEQLHRQQIRRACAYPCIVVLLAAGLAIFLLVAVVPRLEELLRSLGGKLPPLAAGLLAGSHAARTALPGLLALALGVGAALVLLRYCRYVRVRGDRWFLRLPIAGPLYREFAAALFCKIYRSLYLSHQPAPAILEACTDLYRNTEVRRQLQDARRQVIQQGARLSAALAGTGLFPPIAILSIEVGEQSGELAASLERVSVYLQARARERLETMIGWINPVLTTVMVSGVGTLMIAFFQALYQVVYAGA